MNKSAFREALQRPPKQVVQSDAACFAFSEAGEELAKYLAKNLGVRYVQPIL
jgi:hypothetical protein